jgi:hypothetical protein
MAATLARQLAHPRDQRHALRHADGAAGVEDVEKVRALQSEVKNLAQREPILAKANFQYFPYLLF